MQEKHRIKDNLNFVLSLKMLAEVYEEISIMRIQRIKNSVLKTRNFLEALADIFHDVKRAYESKIAKTLREKGKQRTILSLNVKNGKEVAVLLSANTKLYGDIVPEVFKLFMKEIEKGNADTVVSGRLGKDMLDETGSTRSYTYFDIPDANVTFEDLKALISYIIQYQKVTVFYGKFNNMVSQSPVFTTISGQEILDSSQREQVPAVKFIFEPSLDAIMNFFETQIFTSYFKQTIDESQLARYASRIRSMEEAIDNMSERMKRYQTQEKRINGIIRDKKQLDRLSGISIWGTIR